MILQKTDKVRTSAVVCRILQYPIRTQNTDKTLVTPPGLRVSMGTGNPLLSAHSFTRVDIKLLAFIPDIALVCSGASIIRTNWGTWVSRARHARDRGVDPPELLSG
ncbi:hypothetical protein EVAR_13983_1 [Eumeta japonica]|uniref:Uncharacterized protein n=1 Tax=Eumeta variegata TaxID=151549 RepID=A0A4C1U8J3_EUMVA|nr:hypothetical protein EVAR_13983_1 [Eumeta japonica]